MSDEHSIPSSVDMTGDLSRTKFNERIQHHAPVGDPIGGGAYDANKPQQHWHEASNSNPLKCAIVLGTLDSEGNPEYRVGRLSDTIGMWTPLDPSDKARNAPIKLRSQFVRECFGASEVYTDRHQAVEAADLKYPRNHGIKVIRQVFQFPV
jgi:hypothetical protein